LEPPLHIPEYEDEISIVESSCTMSKSSKLFFLRDGAADIGGYDLVESSYSIMQEMMELSLERCYQGHFGILDPDVMRLRHDH
jgi:hypothetical protein